MGQRFMDKPPTDPKRSAKHEDAPAQPDPKLRRIVLQAAEACREHFDEDPSHDAYGLAEILDSLGRHRHLIDAVHRFMGSKDCPAKTDPAPVVAIGDVPIRRPVVRKDGDVVYQKIHSGRQWEGPSMVRVAAWAIKEHKDPLDVASAIITKLPPLLRADCRHANRDPAQVGLAIAKLIERNAGWNPQGWHDPEAVLRAVLRELGHPRPDNVTRA